MCSPFVKSMCSTSFNVDRSSTFSKRKQGKPFVLYFVWVFYCVVLYCTIYLQEWTPSTLFENTVFGLDVKTKSAVHRQNPYEYTNPVESAASMAGTVYLIDNWLYSLWLLYSEYSTESIWRN